MNKIADKSINNLEGVLNKFFGNISENNMSLEDLEKAIPQFQEVMDKYNNIINGKAEETK